MIHDAKILLKFMQKYGKTLKHDRIFPIFFNFAVKINERMKYFEVNFMISAPAESFQDVRDIVAALAGQAGFETFEETEKGLKGYVQQELFDAGALNGNLEDLPFPDAKVSYDVLPADEADWNAPWEKEGFDPIHVGDRLVIHDGVHLPTFPLAAASDVISVEIDAKLAFGTGNHQTTRLMCNALLNLPLNGKSLLDCGTGTGILSIVALLLGAKRAIAYDIDDWSAINALHNAVLNHVSDRMTVYKGDVSILENMDETFDVVLANINRNILLADMPQMCKHLSPNGGILLLSGFYAADVPLLIARADEQGLKLMNHAAEGEWTMLRFQQSN